MDYVQILNLFYENFKKIKHLRLRDPKTLYIINIGNKS